MKKLIINTFNSAVIVLAALLVVSCGGDDPTVLQKNTKLLKSVTWKVKSVTVDGVDKTSEFTDFTLKFDATSFSTTNGNIVWPASDSWSFSDDTSMTFVRGDGVEVHIVKINGSTLTMNLTWDQTIGSGRSASIGGEYIFEFVK